MKLGLTITIVWEFYLLQDSFHMPKFLCILTVFNLKLSWPELPTKITPLVLNPIRQL
jgi:hypothetical protein